jgi:hypothetical protein
MIVQKDSTFSLSHLMGERWGEGDNNAGAIRL